MHVLIVVDHPDPQSFTAHAAARFADGAREAGHTVEIADLHAEGFDPRWGYADAMAETPETVPADVIAEQARIARADAICLVFPLFWWGMPAMMKGWVDRVWSWGWAYDQLGDYEVSLQRPRSGLLLIPAGVRSETLDEDGFGDAMETIWTRGTFGYFGFSPRQLAFLCGSEGSEARRAALLERSHTLGRDLPPPGAVADAGVNDR